MKSIQFWKSCEVYNTKKVVKNIQFWRSCEKVYTPKKVVKKYTTLEKL